MNRPPTNPASVGFTLPTKPSMSEWNQFSHVGEPNPSMALAPQKLFVGVTLNPINMPRLGT